MCGHVTPGRMLAEACSRMGQRTSQSHTRALFPLSERTPLLMSQASAQGALLQKPSSGCLSSPCPNQRQPQALPHPWACSVLTAFGGVTPAPLLSGAQHQALRGAHQHRGSHSESGTALPERVSVRVCMRSAASCHCKQRNLKRQTTAARRAVGPERDFQGMWEKRAGYSGGRKD